MINRELHKLMAYLSWINEEPGWTKDMMPEKPEELYRNYFPNGSSMFHSTEDVLHTIRLTLELQREILPQFPEKTAEQKLLPL